MRIFLMKSSKTSLFLSSRKGHDETQRTSCRFCGNYPVAIGRIYQRGSLCVSWWALRDTSCSRNGSLISGGQLFKRAKQPLSGATYIAIYLKSVVSPKRFVR